MASEKHIICGPCRYDDVTKDANKWCMNCEEGLCEDCDNAHRKNKISRYHQVISIEDYRKIGNVSISQVCEQHGENLEWFCKIHDEVLCMVCVSSEHKACSGIIPIGVAATNSRQSSALSNLEEAIEGTLRNVKQCIINRESASKDIDKQELAIKTTILETRTKINCHLDKMQDKLLHDLQSTVHTCKSKYTEFLQNLESKKEMLTKLREQTQHLNQFSSNIHVFLGTREVDRQVISEVESIKSEIGATKDYELQVAMHSLITKLANEVKDFGQINVSDCTRKIAFRDTKIDQTRIGINFPTRNISNVKLQLIKDFQIRTNTEICISGCVMLPNGNLLMGNSTKKKHLIEYNDKDGHMRALQVSGSPFVITVMDFNRIVVTYPDEKLLEILNSNNFKIEKKIKLQSICYGISVGGGRLYILMEEADTMYTIQVLDLSGRQLETLKISSKTVRHITTGRDRIFYTDFAKNSVHCCSLKGIELWQFKSESLACPRAVAVDNYNNVYVACDISNINLTIIQRDGEDSRTLLTERDGIDGPTSLYYDKEKRTLIMCDRMGKVALYKIV